MPRRRRRWGLLARLPSTREWTPPPRTGPRLVLASGLAVGLVSLVRHALNRPDMLGANAHVYYLAGRAVLAGGDVYAVAPPAFPQFGFVYPPIVAAAFVPYALLGSPAAAFAAQTGLTVAGGLLLARLLVGLAERDRGRLPRLDRALVAAYVLLSVHAVPTLFYGNVNLLLALALAGGAVVADRSAVRAGARFALPAVVKVFPAGFCLWLLRDGRRPRAPAGAVAAGLAAAGASLALFGVDAHRTYLAEALLPRRRTGAFVGGLDPNAGYLTLRRPLSVALPGAEPWLIASLAGFLLAPVAAYLLTAAADDPTAELVALVGAVGATLLALPSYQTYYVFLLAPLVPLLYRLGPGPARTTVLAGALVANLAITPDGVRSVLGPPVAGPVLAVLEPVLTVGSPRLYGTLLVLAGCAIRRRRRADESAGADA